MLFCLGLGYTSCFVARHFDGTVYGTRTRPHDQGPVFSGHPHEREQEIKGIAPFLEKTTHLLVSIPPQNGFDPVLPVFQDTILHAPHLQWVGYLSATSVYGDTQGAWVDENIPPAPKLQRGIDRFRAEESWQRLGEKLKAPVHIFRLSGIYGPGRNALISLQQNTAKRVLKQDHVTSRCHAEDIAQIISATQSYTGPHRLWNVADDAPTPPSAVVEYAASLMGIEPPPAMDWTSDALSNFERSFYEECRRTSNNRVKDELSITLKYPSYREGLKALWEKSRS